MQLSRWYFGVAMAQAIRCLSFRVVRLADKIDPLRRAERRAYNKLCRVDRQLAEQYLAAVSEYRKVRG